MYSSTIGRAAVQVAEKMKFENRKYAPIASDIIKLTSHLKEQIKISVSRLDKSFSYKRWEDLNKYCMLSLLIFNRKRKAEVQYLTLSDYKRKEKVKDNTEINQSLSKTEQMISKRYFHGIVRGKLAWGCPTFNRRNPRQIYQDCGTEGRSWGVPFESLPVCQKREGTV